MPPAEPGGRKTADDWVLAGLLALAAGPIAEVKVERLAADLGVTKGSFYWHFDGRDALLDAMRQRWAVATDEIIEQIDAGTQPYDPVVAVEALLTRTLGDTGELDGVEAAIREWSASDAATAEVCSRVDERRLRYVARHLRAAGVSRVEARRRAEVLYRIVIGEYVWRRYGGRPVRLETVLEVARHLCRP